MPQKTSTVSASQDGAIELAVEKLLLGNVIGVPTETVYGLAADACNKKAVASIYKIKSRPSFNPLICHVNDFEMATKYIEVSPTAQKLMSAFWPGPLTIVSAAKPNSSIAPAISAGLNTLAVRCPNNEATRAIIKLLGRPVAAPSANPSGKLSPTTANSVFASLDGKIPLIIDGGQTDIGIESTIVAVEDKKITLLRPGSISADEISDCTGLSVYDRDTTLVTAPGQLKSHYAPNSKVILNCRQPNCSTYVGFSDLEVERDLNLSPSGDLAEAAHNLFEFLREADTRSNGTIAIAPIPNNGIGIAINDRLQRAAAPRDNEIQDKPE